MLTNCSDKDLMNVALPQIYIFSGFLKINFYG